jgi:hypothetical protein
LGRHKDPETLTFLSKLKQKGESLGYKTEEEYPMLEGLYFADMVWQLVKDQAPLVTFEVETSAESSNVFKNTSKYFDTYSKDVPKPFRHFMIIMKGRLPEGVRLPMQRYLNSYNVSLFEDVSNDKEAAKILFEELDRLKVQLRELVARYMSAGKIDQTLQDLKLGLQEGMPKFLETENIDIKFSSSKNRPDPLRPFSFHLEAKTSTGEPSFLQRMNDALKTGKPVKITDKDEIKIQIPGHEEGDVTTMEIKPQTIKGIFARFETSNYKDYIESELTSESEDDQFLVLSNVTQHAPWKTTFKIHKKSKAVHFSMHFNQDEGDPYQLVYYIEFFQQAKKENRLIVRNVQDGKVMLDGPFPIDIEVPSEEWMRIWKALAEIQLKTGIRFPMPRTVTNDELKKLDKIYQIITKGEIGIQNKSLTVNFSKDEAQYRLYLAKNPNIIENFKVNMKDADELFGVTIPIGEAQIIIPEARIDLSKLQDGLEKGNDPISIEVSVLPDKQAKVAYRKWMNHSGTATS